MHLILVGLNHRTTPLEVREELAWSAERCKEARVSLLNHVDEGTVLSTCNRTEIYSVAKSWDKATGAIFDFLSDYSGVSLDKIKPHLYELRDREAVTHLFRVASGLDSMIVGEYEVLGQVRRSLEDAEVARVLHYPLLNLFQQAVRVGRKIRQDTAVSRNALSVSAAGVELAKKVFINIEGRKVLVISAGEAGRLAVEALIKSGAANVMVVSRSFDKALSLASSWGGKALPFHQMGEALVATDMVISCSGAPHFIIERPVVEQVMNKRPQRPLLLIDLAVPRDIDPQVKLINRVHLYDIDDLNQICDENRSHREKEIGKAEEIIEGEVTRFMLWWDSLTTVPTITALMEKAEQIRQRQLAAALPKLKSLNDEDRAQVEAMTRAMIKKIFHDPIMYLKNSGNGSEHIKSLRELFKLDQNES
ncbi:MAG: glutamyl-tRNA reductase [Chloroflexi bacterium]|nr:glutamyl-tRNA reductase [Chloroflexota bacterium]